MHGHTCVRWRGGLEGNGNTRWGKGITFFLRPLSSEGGILVASTWWKTLICFLKIIQMIHVLNYIPMPRGRGGHIFGKVQ